MNALMVKLKLDSPLLMTGLVNGDENSAQTLNYIPGSTLRGALIGRYIKDNESGDGVLDNDNATRLFFHGTVRFLNAYPFVNGQRTLPVPASWRKDKHDELKDKPTAYDLALESDPCLELPKPLKKAFCWIGGDAPIRVFDPKEKISVHIGGTERGVVKEDSNTIFRYIALAAGQVFAAMIITNSEDDLATVKGLLEKEAKLHLGGSRSAGYGQVSIVGVETLKTWSEAPDEAPDGVTTITLLSDALLRNDDGQPTLNLDSALKAHLGKEVTRQRAFSSTTRVGSFNRQWGLPVTQGEALQMGSVFVYSSEDFSADDLKTLVEEGIGERRVDGFGRLAVNWPARPDFIVQDLEAEEPQAQTELSESSRQLAQTMAERMLRTRLDEALLARSQHLDILRPPPNHQISRLRALLRKVMIDEDTPRQALVDYFDIAKMREPARKKFDKARVKQSNERLVDWILSLVNPDAQDGVDVMTQLGLGAHQSPSVAGQSVSAAALREEYSLRLVDAVLKRAMKADRDKGGT